MIAGDLGFSREHFWQKKHLKRGKKKHCKAVRYSSHAKFDVLQDHLRAIENRQNQTLKDIQSTPENSNLQGKLKKVRVIGSWEHTTDNKETDGDCISIQTF